MSEGWFTHNNVRIHVSTGGPATSSLSEAQVKQLVVRIQAALLKQARHRSGCYHYPDQSIASMTPEQVGEIVESFRMEAAEA